MQTLTPRAMALPDLLALTAAARQAFEIRRRLGVELPAYQVKPGGRDFFHVIETATGKVRGYRRKHMDACALARSLEAAAQ
ncbi:hypothetical protein D9M70_396590 [compost metagenome]